MSRNPRIPVSHGVVGMKMSRVWAMPSGDTFSIKPIRELIERTIQNENLNIDPFVRNSPFKEWCVSNDLDPDIEAQYHMDALDFLREFDDGMVDAVLFDPPYSPRQVSEVYKKLGKSVNMATTSAAFWGNMKKEVGRIVSPGGVCITCGWNSGGVGKKYGFEIEEVLLVAHGGWHNDTIVTVERKL